MSVRKYDFNTLTPEQLEEIAADYPNAVETIRKPNYRKMAMMAECGAKLKSGKTILDFFEPAEEIPAFLKTQGRL